jgi:hypothetical protein
MSTQTSPDLRDISRRLGHVLRVPVRIQTYRNLCYLVVMFPLGIVYFTLLTVGFTIGIPLMIVVIGIPIIVLLLVLVADDGQVRFLMHRFSRNLGCQAIFQCNPCIRNPT